MKMSTKLSAALLPLLALSALTTTTGCNQDLNPASARGDRYTAEHVVFSGQDDLVDHIAIGTITRTYDTSGILHVTVPARYTLPDNAHIDYRFTYFDENHNLVETSSFTHQELQSNVFEYIQGNASSSKARDFQIDLRSAR